MTEERKEWQQRTMTFSLRKNGKKKEDKHPDLIGQLCIDSELYDLSAWTKTAASGGKWLSGTVKAAYKPAPSVNPKKEEPKSVAGLDDDVPW